MFKIIGVLQGDAREVFKYVLGVGRFNFTVNADTFDKLPVNVGDCRVLDQNLSEVINKLPDLSSYKEFLDIFEGRSKYGNSNDLVIASEAAYLIAVDMSKRPELDDATFSVFNFSELMVTFCKESKIKVGMTLVEANSHTLRLYSQSDEKFVKDISAGTALKKDLSRATEILKEKGLAAFIYEAHLNLVEENRDKDKKKKSPLARLANFF